MDGTAQKKPQKQLQHQTINDAYSGQQKQPSAPAAAASPMAAAAAANESQCWTPTYIPLPVVDEHATASRGEEVLVDINFADFIGKGSRNAKNNMSQRKYLSSAYSYNSANFRKNQLAPLFQKACAQGGFDIIMKGWEEYRQMIRFACQRSRLYKAKGTDKKEDGDNNNSNRKRGPGNISRPLTQTCPFNFSVFWETGNVPDTGRWFVCACGMGKCTHEGHSHKPWQEEAPKLAPHDVAFQQFMPQYQQLCLLAASGDLYQMDYAGKLLQESIYKLQAKAPAKKRKRGRKPKVDKELQFASLEGVILPYASKPPASMPYAVAPAAAKAAEQKKMPAAAPKPAPKSQAIMADGGKTLPRPSV